MFDQPPSISGPIRRREEKNVRTLVKNDYETFSVIFSLRSKLWPPRAKMATFFEFFFSNGLHHFGKDSLPISGTNYKYE